MNNDFKAYYKKTRLERLEVLKNNNYISKESYNYLLSEKTLTNDVADKFIENQIGIYSLPLGIATNFLINNKEYVIPMCIEEPSVIAAASNAAKTISENGGITASIDKKYTIGQIAVYNVMDFDLAIQKINENHDMLIDTANKAHVGINLVGGGARKIYAEKKEEFLVIYLVVDTVDAMGANILNTMLEAVSVIVENLIEGSILMSIISNYSTKSIVKASCKIEIEESIGKKIELAYKFAKADIYRAVTNNKGILNGIDALTIVTGNDFRAMESSIHSYASRNGKYEPLTTWEYKKGYLYGNIEIPSPVATVGGSIGLNYVTKIALEILKNPNAKELSMIMASLGLAQNFAALKALVTTGIQKGHMKLHARTIAIFAGAKEEEIDILVNEMIKLSKIDLIYAKEILGEIRK
ncbi:hydroxymethylglutaryl-CoA reductase, degradative [Oceanivirga salmonicida]|uniref:hydroxymethylglutaryl-CoA reductase, degradative n=1 Tax=Oceanivirga salmonicida TaxID=1769291 RepID=UPI000834A31C|nr:hydroxymethylglutaryl-CoA reductase, degradative [Oceanivirga salmonicida]